MRSCDGFGCFDACSQHKNKVKNSLSQLYIWTVPFLFFVGGFSITHASSETVAVQAASEHGVTVITFLWIVIILLVAKLAGFVERFGQPAVLGELVAGVILGNLILLNIGVFEAIKIDPIIAFFAELGVVILLFQIGLESNLHKMRKVGGRALSVAVFGVIAPFVLGVYVVGPWLLPGLEITAYLFLGAALTATSVGITARVFKDLGKLHIRESQIVLGAAVIDDILGLIILAVVSALVTIGAVSIGLIGWIIGKAILFLVGSVFAGQVFAPQIGRLFSKIHTGAGMKFTLALSFGLLFAYFAELIGLAPIVGAFAAGLILDPVHFRFFNDPIICDEMKEAVAEAGEQVRKRVGTAMDHYAHRHVEDLIEPVALLFVPIFFVVTGMNVDLATLFDPKVLLVALGVTVVAFIGKLIAGMAAGSVNKMIVGVGMVPRGEVGLIFATIGKGLGVVSDEVFSIIVIMVILTTLLTPPILTVLLKRRDKVHALQGKYAFGD